MMEKHDDAPKDVKRATPVDREIQKGQKDDTFEGYPRVVDKKKRWEHCDKAPSKKSKKTAKSDGDCCQQRKGKERKMPKFAMVSVFDKPCTFPKLEIVPRHCLTKKKYIDMLATASRKCPPDCQKKMVLRKLKPVSARIKELALPTRQRILMTLQSGAATLPAALLDNLVRTLENETCMTPEQASLVSRKKTSRKKEKGEKAKWSFKEGKKPIQSRKSRKSSIGVASTGSTFDKDSVSCQYLMAERFVRSILKWKCSVPKAEFNDITEVIVGRLIDMLEYTPPQDEDRKSQQLRFLADTIACWVTGVLFEVAQNQEEKLLKRCKKKEEEMKADEEEEEEEDEDDEGRGDQDIGVDDGGGDDDDDDDDDYPDDDERKYKGKYKDDIEKKKHVIKEEKKEEDETEGEKEIKQEIKQEMEETIKQEIDESIEQQEEGPPIKTEMDIQTDAETQDAKIEVKMEAEPEIDAEKTKVDESRKEDIGTEEQPVPEVVVKTEQEVVAKTEPEVVAKTEPESEPEVVAKTESELKPVPDSEPEPKPEPEAELEPVAVAEAELEPVAVAESEPEPESELKPVAVAEPELEPVAVAEAEAEPKSEIPITEPIKDEELVVKIQAEEEIKDDMAEKDKEEGDVEALEARKEKESIEKVRPEMEIPKDVMKDLVELFKTDLPFITFGKIIDTVYKMVEDSPENMGEDPITNGIHRAIYEKLSNIVRLENPELLTDELKNVMDVVCGKIANWLRSILSKSQLAFMEQLVPEVESKEIRDWTKWLSYISDVAKNWNSWLRGVIEKMYEMENAPITRGEWQDWTKSIDAKALLWRRFHLQIRHEAHRNLTMMNGRRVVKTGTKQPITSAASEQLLLTTDLRT